MKETERVTIDAVKSAAAQLERMGLIVIIRAPSSDHLVDAAQALRGGGVRAMEITLNTPGALETIAKIRREIPEMLCGAGTILNEEDARRALEAGAQFIVTPTLQMDSIGFCEAQGAAMVAGCASPTEALAAHRAGADFIKVFPAARFSLGHIAAMLEELPQLNVVPTGGVTPENLAGFFEAGCRAVAAGSNLVTKEILRTKDWKSLETAARRYIEAIRQVQNRLNLGGPSL